MKTTLKIVQFKDDTWGAKRKTCFGWKYLDYSDSYFFDNDFYWHYGVPTSGHAKCNSKKEVIVMLETLYHGYRELQEKE